MSSKDASLTPSRKNDETQGVDGECPMPGPSGDNIQAAANVELGSSIQHINEVVQGDKAGMPGTSTDMMHPKDVGKVNIPITEEEENGLDPDAPIAAQMGRLAGEKRKAPTPGTSGSSKGRVKLEPATELASLEYSEGPNSVAYVQKLISRSKTQRSAEGKDTFKVAEIVNYFRKHPEFSQSDSIKLGTFMNESFFVRQSEILQDENFSIQKLMVYYPGLHVYKQVIQEFMRWIDLQSVGFNSFQNEMNRHLEEQCAHHTGCEQSVCVEAQAVLDSADEGDARKKTAQMILYLCFITDGEWKNEFVKFPNQLDNAAQDETPPMKTRAQPTIQLSFRDGMDIYSNACAEVTCENVMILQNLGFYSSVFAVYYLYYCFNLKYRPIDETIFKLFDTALEVGKRATPIVVTL